MKKVRLLLLLLIPILGFSQNSRTITGQVFSKTDGMPLPGASIFVDSKSIANETGVEGIIESTSIGAITDFDGNFSLTIPSGIVKLTVSYMGYETQILYIDSKTSFEVHLTEDMNALSEVVVTGYQKVEKRKLAASVAQVNMKDAQQIGVASVDQLLQGQAAGVVVTSETGAPGTPAKIRIRGTASLSGPQDPLWVIDGLPLEGNDVPNFGDKDNIDQLRNYAIAGINPDDIKDITILKDAAATAIYGARAANGVIVVTTKKGTKGKMNINFSANTFYTMRPDMDKLNLMNANEKVAFELSLAQRDDLDFRTNKGEVMRILTSANELDIYRNNGFNGLSNATQMAINALKENQTNWGDLLYQSAANTQYSLSIAGGAEKSDYYFSLGYYNEDGTTIGTGYERYNITLKNNYQLSDRFKAGVSLFASQSNKESYVTGTDAFTNPANYSRNANPYLAPYKEDGSYNYDQDIEGFEGRYVPFNFLEERDNTSYDLNNNALKAIFDASYRINNDLKLSTQLGLQLNHNSTEKYGAADSYFTRKIREKTRRYSSDRGGYYYFLPEGGIIQNWEDNFFQYNWKSLLEYSTIIGDKHEIETMVGSELRRSNSKIIATQGFGYDKKTLNTKPIIFPNESTANESTYKAYDRATVENAYASFYATGSYTYDRKYTLFGSVRYDGSNLFGVDPKYKYLPLWSTAGSWLVSEEEFFRDNNIISNLRLRASYGLQGNIDRNTSPFVVGEYNNATILPGYNESSIVVTSPPNDKLRWEKTENYNLGADVGFFDQRINMAFDFYQRKSSDLIGLKSVPLENGFEFTNLNWAQVTNKGYELSIATRNINAPNFKWTTNFNISHNKSHVDKIQIRENSFLPSREGLPVNAVFALKTAGIDENGYPLFWKGDEKVSAVEFFDLVDPWADFFPGYLTQSNLSNEEFRGLFTYVGDRDPKFSGGFINTFKYKNLDFTVATNFNLKQTVVKNLPYNPSQVDRGQNYTTDILNTWSPNNTGSNLPGIVGETSGSGDSWMAYKWFADLNPINTMSYLDTFVDEMSYLRVSSMRLGYSLPETITSKLHINQLRFNIEGRNLFVFSSDYSGYFDPETFGNIYAQPISKSISLGLNVSF
ncbi:TonB-linked outer membrane protein, SusC/RagA family [Arenibacter nanhaiticus]|uniref:TonB-linked outer membrane protein, SusC/RagA family n=1 Tax=Arenibacter nanhaiticus TaxID=558155 RepID=A0A1M6BWW8_9FLAO|nr:SusC/RagA family TonB-linked outer membrane protein [Arenibacter nanhaiticus]SHI53255.1 TonB-linked outer membrane protein, SusC/RagA family [Arenibacter nanhaiticus]